jgi:hypothetical protein
MHRRDSAERGIARSIALCLIGAFAASGCLDNPGSAPPESVLNFPIASAMRTLDPVEGPRFLYVANSNFDLRYNAATLQSYDLEVANTAIDTLCTPPVPPAGCRGPLPPACVADPNGATCLASPPAHDACSVIPRGSRQAALPAGVFRVCEVGPDQAHAADPALLVDEVRIGSFADGMELSPDGNRLYLPVRSDADLTRVDLDAAGNMDCGGGFGTTNECDDSFRRSDRTVASARGLELPPDPVAISVGPLSDFPGHGADEGDYIVMAHRSGDVSYFLDEGTSPSVDLIDVLPGFPTGISTLVRQPETGLIWGPAAVGGAIARVGVALDETFEPGEADESFLFDAGSLIITDLAIGSGGDLRDLAFDPRAGNEGVYLLSRSPSGLILGRREPLLDEALVPAFDFYDIVRVGSGPSRLAIAELGTSAGPRMFAFVSCFDSRNLYIVDIDLGVVVAVSPEFSGPFEIEIDPVRERLYVIDFRTSVIRIVDLERMLSCLDGTVTPSTQECAPEIAGLIGIPDAAEELE